MAKFIIPAKKKVPNTECPYPVIRIYKDAYNALTEMCSESDLSMCELVSKAVMFAYENAEYQRD